MGGPMKARYPVADVLPLLEAAARSLAGPTCGDRGYSALARRIGERTGTEPLLVERLLVRLRTGTQTTVGTIIADRLAVGLSLHPANVWGRTWDYPEGGSR